MHMADRRRGQRGLGPGAPSAPASRCGSCSPSRRRSSWSTRSTSATCPTRSPPRRRSTLLTAGRGRPRRPRRGAAAGRGLPGLHHLARAGSATPTRSCAGLAREAVAAGFTPDQAEGRRRPRRRHAAAARSPAPPSARTSASRSTPTSAGTSTRPSRWMKALAEFDPYWIEEPTSPDDVLGHAADRAGPSRRSRSPPASTSRTASIFKQLLQAGAIDVLQLDAARVGGVNENLAILLLAAKFGVPVCPHAGGVGLCELVQHLSMFDYVALSGHDAGPGDRVRRPPARALRRPGGRRERPLPRAAGAGLLGARCTRSRSRPTRSPTGPSGAPTARRPPRRDRTC